MNLQDALRAALAAEHSRCLKEGHDFDVADAMAAIWPLLDGPASCTETAPCEVRAGLGMQLDRAQAALQEFRAKLGPRTP